MRISWRALLLAPLPVPLLAAGLFMALVGGGRTPLVGFVAYSLIGGAISYGATMFVLIPAVLVLQRLVTLTSRSMSLLGAGLGLVPGVGLTTIMHQASGQDSGPPADSYFQWLASDESGALFILFCMACGTINSLLYHLLAARDSAG